LDKNGAIIHASEDDIPSEESVSRAHIELVSTGENADTNQAGIVLLTVSSFL
jgi:hypothetical protein